MKRYRRIFTIVIDSLGVGALPDAADYGDAGTDTLGHISQRMEEFHIPNLQKLGMANLHPLKQVEAAERPMGYYTYLSEASTGKDTMTGHWEMMGLYITKPFQTFTENGFPKELLDELSERTGRVIIGNKSASGTEILEELAEEEIATGHMIVYTSADSVLQICGNEETFGLEELYRCCEIAREITMKDEWKVGRVIARPYVGERQAYRLAALFAAVIQICIFVGNRPCAAAEISDKRHGKHNRHKRAVCQNGKNFALLQFSLPLKQNTIYIILRFKA